MLYYRQIAIDAIEKTVAAASSSGMIQHSRQKGRLREIVVEELVKPFLTPHIKAATGTIVDPNGGQSNQIDVILYDEQVTPPILYSEREGVIPCHAVLATIEVKSTLTRDELRKAVGNAASVKRRDYAYNDIPFASELLVRRRLDEALLRLLPEGEAKAQKRELGRINSPACYVFAFTSNLSLDGGGKNEVTRLLEVVEECNRNEGNNAKSPIKVPISGLCVADRAFHYCGSVEPIEFRDEMADTRQKRRSDGYWASHNVVLGFISHLVDICSTLASQRWRIPLDVYFSPH